MKRAIYIHCLAALRQRQLWIGLVIATTLWPAAVLFSPLAASLGNTRAATLANEVAFIAMLASLAVSEPVAARLSWMSHRVGQLESLVLGIVSRFMLGLAAGALALLPATVIGNQVSLPQYLSVAITALHLAVLYCLSQGLGFRATARSVLITFVALAIPASLKGEGAFSRSLIGLFDPRAHLAALELNWLTTCVQIGFICILVLFSSLASQRHTS